MSKPRRHERLTPYVVPDGPKMLRETLAVAQSAIGTGPRAAEHRARLGRLIEECERLRPLGPGRSHDGPSKRCTEHCGCRP